MPPSPEPPAAGLARYLTLRSGALLVVANIIGSGIFTTTGFQAADLGRPDLILGLWIAGGALAFCGALCYAELGTLMPRAGGEYVYLRATYGGAFGFMSAFVSLVAGFSAPIAAACAAAVNYFAGLFPDLESHRPFGGGDLAAIAIIWTLVLLQRLGARRAMDFSDLLTALKIVGMVAFIIAILASGRGDWTRLTEPAAAARVAGPAPLAAMATSMIFVMYCYSGWNASAYMTEEFRNPSRDLPWSLLAGTGAVTLLYLAVNVAYFYAAGAEGLAGQVEVGLVAARRVLGERGVALTSALIGLSLVVSALAMTIAGPRVYHALGGDYPLFAWLARGPAGGSPWRAAVVQGAVTTVLLLTGRVDQIQQYAGFTLTLFSALAVSCVIVQRVRRPDVPRAFRAWGYPWTPLLFLAVSAWMMIWAVRGRPVESLLGLATVAAGGVLFRLTQRGRRRV